MPRIIAAALGLLLLPAAAWGQAPPGKAKSEPASPQAPALPPMVAPWTPPEDYDRYVTPRDLVHRNAAWKAEQRRQRMAGLSWMGYSPSRPPASPVPTCGSYSPQVIGTGLYSPLPGAIYQPGLPRTAVSPTRPATW